MHTVPTGFASYGVHIPSHIIKPQIQFFVCKVLYDRMKAEGYSNLKTRTKKSDRNVSSGQILIIFTTMPEPFHANFYSVDLIIQSFSLHASACCTYDSFHPFWFTYGRKSFLLSGWCFKCMERRVFKRREKSDKMNKISNFWGVRKKCVVNVRGGVHNGSFC